MTQFAEPEEHMISSWLASALINGDYSSFSYNYDDEDEEDEAIKEFDDWVADCVAGRAGHWSADSDETSIEMCAVFGSPAECCEVVFHPIKS